MDEQMIEQIARAIDAAVGYDIPRDDAVAAATAAHSVMAGKVAELEDALRRIAQPVFVAEPAGSPESAWQAALSERINIARAALAPYPERRHE